MTAPIARTEAGTTLAVRVGDSYLSPTWAIVVDGAGIDIGDGWTVRAQARTSTGRLRIDWSDDDEHGTAVLTGTAQVAVGTTTVTTSTLRLYLTAAFSAELRSETLRFDVELNHPTYGPLGDPYRVTVVSGFVSVTPDVTEVGP
ncbi:hypothetical protein [Pseudonocardia alni]|uniref:hypothetical protein n=1 Tax=Pseudonocardia alni TaxID=33907 RepID=UPI0033327961